MTTTINTLERLAILVVAVVGIVFIYGMLSMALARPIPPPSEFNWIDSLDMTEQPTFSKRYIESQEFDSFSDPEIWILWVKIGSRPVEAKNWGTFGDKGQCEYIARLVTLDIRKTDKTSHLEINCELREQT